MSRQTKVSGENFPLLLMKQGKKPLLGDPIGLPGLKRSGGFLQEEFIYQLQGSKGAQRYREMADNSALVHGLLLHLKSIMRATPWRIEAFSSKAEDRKRAEFVQAALDDLDRSHDDVMTEILTFLEYGFAPMEVTYKVRRGYKDNPALSSQYNDGAYGWSGISLRAQESLSEWEYDEAGRLQAFRQMPAPDYRERRIPMDRLLLFRTSAMKDNPEGQSLLRGAYWDYYYAKKLTELSAIGAERDIAGIPVFYAPADLFRSDATSAMSATLTQLKKIGEQIRNDEQACVLVPQAYDADTKQPLFKFELLASPGGKQFNLSEMIQRHETRMAMALAADWIMFGHEKVGSYALTSNRTELWALVLDAFLDRVDETFNHDAIPRLALINGWPMDRLPYRTHGQVNRTKAADLAAALQAYINAGGILDANLDAFVREVNGWPTPDLADLAMPKPEIEPEPEVESEEEHAENLEGAQEASADAPADPKSEEQEDAEDAAEEQLDKADHQPRSRVGTFVPNAGNIASAMKLLGERQRVGGGDAISHGFPVVDKPPFRLDRDYREEIEAAEEMDVPMSSLKATNVNVRRNGVKAFIERPGLVNRGQRTASGVLEDLPVAFSVGESFVLYDGHHRTVAARLLGETSIRARVVRPGVKKSPPWHVEDRGDKWVVILDESGEVVGEHGSQPEALAHLRALYANVKKLAEVPKWAALQMGERWFAVDKSGRVVAAHGTEGEATDAVVELYRAEIRKLKPKGMRGRKSKLQHLMEQFLEAQLAGRE